MTRRQTATTGVIGAVLILIAACSRGPSPGSTATAAPGVTSSPVTVTGSSAPSPPTTSSGTAASTPLTQVQQQVLAAYLGMQRAFERAAQTPGTPDTDLRTFADGAALQLLRDGLASLSTQGLRSEGQTRFHPVVEELAPATGPTSARVRDCMDTRAVHSRRIDGQPYQDTPGGRRLVTADLTLAGGLWKVTGLGIHQVGSCTG